MEFRILGNLEVWTRGGPLPLGRLHDQVTLAALVVDAGRTVPLSRLIDVLWDDDPPGTAAKLVRNAVSRLRGVLEPYGLAGVIVTERAGYRLAVAKEAVDAGRFEAMAADAARMAAEGHRADAADKFSAALELWRGPALAGLPGRVFHAAAIALEERRYAVADTHHDLQLALGRHRDIVGELSAWVADQPLREHTVAQYMLALYRCDRQADALAVYRRARTLLTRELGLEPSAKLRRLHEQILTGDPELDLVAVSRNSPPWRAHINSSDLPPPRQLPCAVPHFVGRADELKILHSLLERGGEAGGPVVISAIAGTAGIGKTALAVHWAHQAASRFPDGQLYVNLRGFDKAGAQLTPTEAVRGFLDALGVAPERIPADLNAQAGLYRSLVAGRRILIVLDNARDTEQARPLLPGSPSCLVLETSRNQLTGLVAAEGAHPLTVGLPTLQEARALLASRLGPERLAAEPSPTDELIDLCARLPLALAIAAARAAIHPRLTLANLAADLRDAGRRLDALDTHDSDGATSVRRIFSWSYQNLSPSAARMFRMLGMHPGPDIGTLAAASLTGSSRPDAGQTLAELTRANLVTEPVPGRYAFHDLLRAYGSERAHADESQLERRAALRRMLDYYLHAAQSASARLFPATEPLAVGAVEPGIAVEEFADPEAAQAWFTAEHSVLIAVIRQAFADGFDTHAWQIPTAISAFLDMRYAWQHWADMQEVALAAARRAGDQTGLAHAYDSLGYAQAKTGRFEAARPLLQLALDLFRQLGDCINQARVHSSLAMMHEWQGDLRDALGHAQQALTLCQATSNRTGQARALGLVGWYHSLLGDDRRALVYCERALALHRDLADRAGEAGTLDSLGHAHHHLGDHQRAIDCYRRAIDLCDKLGDRYNQAGGLRHLAEASQAAGDPGEARRALQDAVAILDDLHHPDAQQARDQLRDLGQVQVNGPGTRHSPGAGGGPAV